MGLRSRVKYKYGNRCDKYYSDKGITVAAEWMDDFAAFLTHIGPAPSEHHSVDRIRGGEGYVPGNVRWATIVEQNRNKSDNIVVSWNGADRLLVELAEEYGLPYQTLNWRYQRAGWPIERALTTPIKRMKNNVYPQALAADKAYEAAQATTP
jgi:hypothetical protein